MKRSSTLSSMFRDGEVSPKPQSFTPHGYYKDGYYFPNLPPHNNTENLTPITMYTRLIRVVILTEWTHNPRAALVLWPLASLVIGWGGYAEYVIACGGLRECDNRFKIVTIVFRALSCVCSLLIVRTNARERKIESLAWVLLKNTSSRQKVQRAVVWGLYTVLIITLVLTAVGCIPRLRQLQELREVGLLGGYSGLPCAQLCVVCLSMWSVCGLGVFSFLTWLHLLRVESTFRALMRGTTSIHDAIRRVHDLDVSIAHFGQYISLQALVVAGGYFLTFFLNFIFEIAEREDQSEAVDHPAYIARAILQPGLITMFFLFPPAMLNNGCDYLRKSVARFCLRQIDDPNCDKDTRSLVKDFFAYVKDGDLSFRLAGVRLSFADAWKMFVLTWSAFVAAVKL